MYRSIVVGTDGSSGGRAAVARAVELAQGSGPTAGGSATVHLVSAYQPISAEHIAYLQGAMPEAFRDEVGADLGARTALAEGAALASGAGVAHTTHSVRGIPGEALLAVAAETGADLIVVGSRGLGAAKRLLLGSVSSALAHDAPIDVLIVRVDASDDAGDDIVDADGSESDETVPSALGRVGEAARRFETDHPDLVKIVNDVSYYLSGLGI